MPRTPPPFSRRAPRFKPQPTVLVICEDIKSGKLYIQDATVHFRVNVKVEVAHCGKTDPLGIVRTAIIRKKVFDKVYCVIDRDTHQNFDEAIALADTANDVEIVASYPCMEFWYLLHFGYKRAPYNVAGKRSPGEQVVAQLRRCAGMEAYDKGARCNTFELLKDRLPDARRISAQILTQAREEGNLNPSSRMHELIDRLEELSTPQRRK